MDSWWIILLLIAVLADTVILVILVSGSHGRRVASVLEDEKVKDVDGRGSAHIEDSSLHSQEDDSHSCMDKVSEETRSAFIKTLKEIGCPHEKTGDLSIHTRWQGENFTVDCGARFVMIWDPMWYAVKNDSEDFAIVVKAVNHANFHFGPVIVITAPDDKGICGLCSRREMLVDISRSDNSEYLKAVLASFFEAKATFRKYYLEEKAKTDPAILN